MTFRGIIDHGRLVLEDGSQLPEGSRVEVTLRGSKSSRVKKPKPDPLAQLSRHAVATGAPDLADQHDHYAYGTPKRAGAPAKVAKRRRKSA